jgi:hypothetical protein
MEKKGYLEMRHDTKHAGDYTQVVAAHLLPRGGLKYGLQLFEMEDVDKNDMFECHIILSASSPEPICELASSTSLPSLMRSRNSLD